MGTGTKVTVAFLAGAAAGAAALAYLNRDKLDLDGFKSIAAEWLNKGLDLKDSLLAKLDLQKKDDAEVATEAPFDESDTQPESTNQRI